MNNRMSRGGQGGQAIIPGGALGKARYALALGRADEAERIVRKRLEQNPNDIAARVLLSQTLLQERRAQEAVDEARKATRANPKDPDAQLALSASLLQTARFSIPEEARTAAERAVHLAPKLARARVQLAEVYIADKKEQQAVATADEAIKLEPRGPSGYFIKALALNTLKDYQGAAQAADSAIRFDRDHQLPQAEYIRATSLVELKRYDEALTALSAAERGNPLLGGPQADALRGRIYFRQKKYKESYQANLTAQRRNNRVGIFAAPLAGLNMVATGLLGDRGQYAVLILLAVIVVAILYGVSLIPVAGSWISTTLVIALILVLALATVRQFNGSILPSDTLSRWGLAIPGMIAAFLIGGVATLYIVRWVEGFFTAPHAPAPLLLTPTNVTMGGVVGAVLAALLAWGLPQILQRSAGRGAKAA